jgi:uncharacterized protein YcsI (UPF0317 family)
MVTNTKAEEELVNMSPKELRGLVRGGWKGITHNACAGYAQTNLVILPKEYAFDFLLFSNRNPRPCSVIDVTEPGNPHPSLMAPEADLRTDLPLYRVFKDGEVIDEPTDINSYWRDDLVGFLFGCTVGTLWALQTANVSWRGYGLYRTRIPCITAGRLHGHMVLSFRSFSNSKDAVRAIQISSRYPLFHGPPVFIGNPADIGVKNLATPDPSIPNQPITEAPKAGEIVVGYACGVTTQVVAIESRLPFMISHSPGHMFVTDKRAEEMSIL